MFSWTVTFKNVVVSYVLCEKFKAVWLHSYNFLEKHMLRGPTC